MVQLPAACCLSTLCLTNDLKEPAAEMSDEAVTGTFVILPFNS